MNIFRARYWRSAAMLFVAAAGFATATLVGAAIAKTFTLQVAQNAKVTNQMGMTTAENIAVNSRGRALYALTGDGKSHPKCTRANGCFQFWPPLTVSSAKNLSKAIGITGKLGVWHRNGLLQVTLGGHPLYRFAPDSQRDVATGEGIQSFGGTWHVIKASASGTGASTTTMTSTPSTGTNTTTTTTTVTSTPSTGTTTTTPSTGTTTTTTTSCAYPPCY